MAQPSETSRWEPVLSRQPNMDAKKFLQMLRHIDGFDPVALVFEPNKCYAWLGAHNASTGHGLMRIGDQTRLVHRVIYNITYGIPGDEGDLNAPCPCGQARRYQSCCRPTVRHLCEIRSDAPGPSGSCCNPLHMALGTQSDNQRDIHVQKKGRGGVMPGESHPHAKMTDEKALAVWQDIKAGMTGKATAAKHGITTGMVKDMSRGRTWNHVTGIPTAKREAQYARRNEAKSETSLAMAALQKRRAEEVGLPTDHIGFEPEEHLGLKRKRSDDSDSGEEEIEVQNASSKTCNKCGETKDIESFSWKNKNIGKRKGFCKPCEKIENAKHRVAKTTRAERFADELVLRPGEETKRCSKCGKDVPLHGMSNHYWCKACRRQWERDHRLPAAQPMLTPLTKICIDCGETKSLDLFPWKKLNKFHKNHCKACDKVRCQRYKEAKKQKLNA